MKKTINCDVIIPTYRNIDTINRAVDSVLNQTVLPNKIIIIDDHSNDTEYLKVLRELESLEIVNVLYLNKNGGPGTARNKGIEISNAKYIAFLDSDDAWHLNKLEIQYQVMENKNYYLTAHNTIYKNNNIIERISESYISKNVSPKKLLFKNIIATRSVMLKNDKTYFFKENKRFSEDYLMWLEIAFDKKKIGYINENLAFHFYNNFSSGLSSNHKKMLLGEIENFKILAERKKIARITQYLASLFSILKYLKRLVKVLLFSKGHN
ncbi:glycosyltransferase family 2 protein [Macrococcoides caseolyticum]|uniref:glycosyltransferase family 2 protein n=1 Tax=Macrococcoides caseolyticum TaxID=69966 RepID=UPI00105B9D2D|nr:glycosyltransferase family 2 protein [Macrococcus caseolyticus]TDM19510.1 glycosyltransferase [Macrococcus caseolyticus]VUC67798.1 glycosyltransferase [Macrococcus caseolyticus]